MGFLDSVQIPGGAQPPVATPTPVKPGGSFLSGIKQPTATATSLAAHNSQVNAAAQVSKANADYANSIPGFAANFGKAAWNASGIPDQFNQGVEQAKENLPTWAGGTAEGHQGPIKAAESALGAGSGVATALFSPLAPIFKPLGQGVQAAGEALSNTPGARAYGAKYANLPANQKTGAERVIGGIANAANIAGAVLGGVEAFSPKVKGGFLESTKLPVESDAAEHPVNISKPATEAKLPPAYKPVRLSEASHADYAKAEGYEPYTPDDKLPTIKMGPKGESKLPSIQTEAKAERGVPGDLRYEPIKAIPAPKSELAQAHETYTKAQNYKPEPAKSPATPRARTTPVKEPQNILEGKTIYHGTQSDLTSIGKSAPIQYGNPHALYGPGIYVTDNAEVAKGYSRTRGASVDSGKVLAGKIKPGTKLLDLDEKMSPEVSKSFNKIINREYGDLGSSEIDTTGLTAKEAIGHLQEILSEAHIPKYEGAEAFFELQEALSREHGYDGFTHRGGVNKGLEHQVAILFDYGDSSKPVPVLDHTEPFKPNVAPTEESAVAEPGYKPLTPVESTGPERTSTLASKVQASAIAKDMDAEKWDLPGYNQVDMKEQNDFASQLVTNEPEKAMRIAMGQEPPPSHILPEKVFEAVERKATMEGDGETIRKLTSESNLSSQATAMGQRIRALRDRDPFSPVKASREVREAREASPTATKDANVVKSQKSTLTKALKESAPTKDAWASFVKDISCNY